MAQKMDTPTDAGNPFGAIGASLGATLGATLFDTLVDAMVRPETVMRSMQSGQFAPKAAPVAGPGDAPAAAVPAEEGPKRSYLRKGADMFIAYPVDGAGPYDKRLNFVFERSGFANWKLTELRMPAAAQ